MGSVHAGRARGRAPVAHLAVAEHLRLVGLELRALGLLQRARQARDGVVVGAALRAGGGQGVWVGQSLLGGALLWRAD